MWEFIKTSFSLIALFILIVVILGIYISFVGEPGEIEETDNQYETIPGEATTTPTSTTDGGFIELDIDY